MELPRRERGDELLLPGEMIRLRNRLRQMPHHGELTTVIASAFDHRTRMLPFLYADLKMAPGGARAIGSAMADAGFHKTRIVLQQWNREFRPSKMCLDGRIPELFMVSSMLLHSAECDALIRDVCRIAPEHRPLVIAGGPKVNYEPWSVFHLGEQGSASADVAVTGEEFVLLSLLEALLSIRSRGESMRSAFLRARDCGALDEIPGLVYARTDRSGVAEELVDTGIQRLLGDLDELPHPVLGYGLLEPPSRRATLGPHALPAGRVRKHSRIASFTMTSGCRFNCHYCPIPAYNQRQHRTKSAERISDEIERIHTTYGIRLFFGADDNFFNHHQRSVEIAETLARKVDAGSRPHSKIRWGTEATVHDTLAMKEHLPTMRRAGLWALWLGVEDLSGDLVNKGQQSNKTLEAFRLLRESGIFPVPMMMHHDAQPLVTWRSGAGLLNQLGMLRKAGALYAQVLMLTPAPGSRSYEQVYESGLAIRSAGGVAVEPRHTGGIHVIATGDRRPWRRQLNLLIAYLYFFNPIRFLVALVHSRSRIPGADAETGMPRSSEARGKRRPLRRISRKLAVHFGDALIQAFGMWSVLRTVLGTLGWFRALLRGDVVRHRQAPASPIPMRSPSGGAASHALPRLRTTDGYLPAGGEPVDVAREDQPLLPSGT